MPNGRNLNNAKRSESKGDIMDLLKEKIQQETNLISSLENSYPPYAGRYSEENREYELHHVKIRDAFWRRRMLIAKRDGLDTDTVAKVY